MNTLQNWPRNMLSAKGTLKVLPKLGKIYVDVKNDFVQYYYWFISKEYWIRMNTPLHGAHITIYYKGIHSNHDINWKKALQYHNNKIVFEYDPYIIEGGYKKGFIMYYIKVFSERLESIKKELNIIDSNTYKGLHLTISNGKNGVYPDWPKMIQIKTEIQ